MVRLMLDWCSHLICHECFTGNKVKDSLARRSIDNTQTNNNKKKNQRSALYMTQAGSE